MYEQKRYINLLKQIKDETYRGEIQSTDQLLNRMISEITKQQLIRQQTKIAKYS